MGGLLYNTFVSLKAKRFISIFLGVTVLFIVLRMIFPGWRNLTGYVAYDAEGNLINGLDSILALFPLTISIMGLELVNLWVPRCVDMDEKSKIREYLSAMPIGKNTYVASKFVYIGIAVYVFFSISLIWTITAGAFSIDKGAIETADMSQVIMIGIFSFALISSGFELCMFLVLGTKKAMLIKVGLFLALGIALVGFLLFGNMQALPGWSEKFFDWIRTHSFEITLFQILSPASGLLIYFGFYKLTCALYEPWGRG